ncbi:MAG: WD40 repeat domain-containing protein [Promethearchaeota archaeon]
MREFEINKFLKLKLENDITNIYVKDDLFSKCKFLLLNVPNYKIATIRESYSIDDASDQYSDDLEVRKTPRELGLSPEEEFQGHCSNLQAWAESGYSVWLLHSNLAFPLLKRLTEAGDLQAEKVFKNEVARRFLSSHASVINYLIEEGYFEFLKREEFVSLLEHIDFKKIDVQDFIEGIIDFYKYKHGVKFSQQILSEFPRKIMGEKYYFYLPLLKQLTFEGNSNAEKLFFDEIIRNLNFNDPLITNFLKKEGYLEYLNKEEHHIKQLNEISYPKLLYNLRGHIDRVNKVIFSVDDFFLISAGGPFDKSIRIWDLETGMILNSFYGHTSDISTLALSPDGKYVASGSWDKLIMLWEFETGRLIKTLKGHQSWVRSVVFHPEGDYLISASGDNKREEYAIKIWGLQSGRIVRTIEDFMNDVNEVVLSPDGNSLVTVSSESRVNDFTGKIWDFSSGTIKGTLEIYSKTLLCVDISPNGRLVATGSAEGTVKLWTLDEGELLRTYLGHKRPVFSIKFSPDGKYIVSCSGDGWIKIWNVESGDLLLSLIGHSSDIFIENWINTIAISSDGEILASGAMDCSIKIWEIDFSRL